jgi:hypothetical protein
MSTYSAFYNELIKTAEDPGWLAAQLAAQVKATKAMSEGGIGGVLANTDLMTDRSVESLKGAAVLGLLGLLLGGATGAAVSALLGGDPASMLSSAASGGVLGASAGAVGGTAIGTAKADKDFLHSRGIEASVPIPLKTILAPFPIAAAAPIGSHARLEVPGLAAMDKSAADDIIGLSKRKQSGLERREARERIASNVGGALLGLAMTSGKKAKRAGMGTKFHKLLGAAAGAKGADQLTETAHNIRRADVTKEYYDRKAANRRRRSQPKF